MQEKFVLKTLKKVAAIGTGVAMAGATLTGALALDLADYPSPYVVDGTYDDSTALVVGDNANAADTLGLVDISANLQFESKIAVESDSGTVSVEGGKTEKIPLGVALAASSFFDSSLQDDDVSNFFDGTVSFQGTSYDTSEELQFLSGGPVMSFALNSSDDDYVSAPYLEVPARDLVKFFYKFDESINLSTASTTQPLEIDFLGDNLKITSVPTAGTSFTAYVGEEHYLLVDESVTIEVDDVEKTITLSEASASSVVVDVDGITEIISTSNTIIVNGVEITVDSTFSRTERAESSAVLIVGKESTETYTSGNAYIGEPTDGTADWVWTLSGLSTQGTSQVFGIENDFVMNDLDDGPIAEGECLNLPNDYVQVCFDSLSVAAADYATYTFEIDEDLDVSNSVDGNTSLDTLYIHTTASEGIELPAYTAGEAVVNETAAKKTDKVWLYTTGGSAAINGSTAVGGTNDGGVYVDVFYKDPASPSIVRWHGSVNLNASTQSRDLLYINYGNTKDSTNMVLEGNGTASTSLLGLFFDIGPDTSSDMVPTLDDLYMLWGVSTDINSLGRTRSSEEASELIAQYQYLNTSIGTKDEDHRLSYGVIVKDPKSNGASDEVNLDIPQDQVFANIVVRGLSTTVTSGTTSYITAEITPATKLASEISNNGDYQLIVVGGPCANDLVEDLFDLTCDGWSFETGEAIVKLAENGDKVAMLIAGTSADDTRRAAKAVANYAAYTLSGTEVLVSGTTMDDITVGAVPEVVAEEVVEEVVEEEAEVVEEEV